MSISICMATYNGERYLPAQISSILGQMRVDDELVIVDDASNDGTLAFLESIGDPRIRINRNAKNLGHVQSFAKAVGLASRPTILMSDQDDIWVEGRAEEMRRALARDAMLVSTNSGFIDADGRPIAPLQAGLREADSDRHLTNIWRIFNGRAAYYGCAMGIREELRDIILPMPSYVESHDLWIAMAANVAGSNVHLDRITLLRRVHGANASIISRPLLPKLWSRVVFLRSLVLLFVRLAIKGTRLRAIKKNKAQKYHLGAR